MSKPIQSMIKAISHAVCALAIMMVATAPASAQSTKERVLKTGEVVIGIHNRNPWGFRDASGEAAGFSPELVRAALEPLGVKKIKFVITDFGALIPGLLANRFDIVASGLYITPKRCELVAFSDPDLSLKDAVLVNKGNPFNIHSYQDIAAAMKTNPKMTFGATRGSVNTKHAAEGGVPTNRTLMFQNAENLVAAMMAGRVDAMSFSAPTAISILKNQNLAGLERATPFKGLTLPSGRPKSGYSSIAFRKTDLGLRDLYNSQLAKMKADGTVKKIMKKYGFSDSESAPDLTQAQICKGEI